MGVYIYKEGTLHQIAGNAFQVIDEELSAESTNPVQNQAIAKEVNAIKTELEALQGRVADTEAATQEFGQMKPHIILDAEYEETEVTENGQDE